MNPLKQLEACGQAPWLDYLKKSLIEGGELATMIERDGLKGMTSNPSIFEKAIAESDEYADALEKFQSSGDHSVNEIYEHLAVADIQAAADVLKSVFDKTKGRDGYVSLECSPYLANDTEATVAEALRLWKMVGRPNLMVKVPGTPAGLPAIRRLIGRGLNINITLLFSVAVYEQVVEAYLAGLEELAATGGDVSKSASVASFFVSRIDSAVDRKLGGLADNSVADRLLGKIAIANAKVAYGRYKTLFSGPRWEKLAAAGARTQRLLWASTSTKSPAYKDTMYVEELIGRDTVDTIPPATMDAFRDHGVARPDTVEHDLEGARTLLGMLENHGISLEGITAELVEEGVQAFAGSFDKLLGVIAQRRGALIAGGRGPQQVAAGSANAALR
jgi:transaldolase/glucose-6-phosphate isomerase